MPTERFVLRHLVRNVVEVRTRSDDALKAVKRGARWVGLRLSLQAGEIVIDFDKGSVIESPLAALNYRIVIDGDEVFSASGHGPLRQRSGGGRTGTADFSFRFKC